MNYETLVKETLSQKRYNHSVKVAEMCVRLAKKHNEDEQKAYLAGILHDIRKEANLNENETLILESGYDIDPVEREVPPLWHGIAAAAYMKKTLGISDECVLDAVRFHTVARPAMTKLDKIVYLGDLVSEDRTYQDVALYRDYALENLDDAMYRAMKFSIEDTLKKDGKIPRFTFEAYNYYHDRRK